MTRFHAALSLMIAGTSLLFLDPARAQDPRRPYLPESSDVPASAEKREREVDHAKLQAARLEIEILEARIAVKKAEIEEIVARSRHRQAQAMLAKLVVSTERERLTMADVTRASVPFPDSTGIPELPPEVEKRIHQGSSRTPSMRRNKPVLERLDRKIVMAFPDKTPLEDVLKYFRTATKGDTFPNGLPITVDPAGIADAVGRMRTEVSMVSDKVALKRGPHVRPEAGQPPMECQGRDAADLRPGERPERLSEARCST